MPITLGLPKVFLKNLPEESFVRLHYVRDGQIVELFGGEHPRLPLMNSDLVLALGEDQAAQEEQILSHINNVLAKSDIIVTRGQPQGSRSFRFKVEITPRIEGLEIDRTAFASGFWFED